MKFNTLHLNEIFYLLFHKTPLHIAVEKRNAEIVQLLLQNQETKVNSKSIFIQIF